MLYWKNINTRDQWSAESIQKCQHSNSHVSKLHINDNDQDIGWRQRHIICCTAYSLCKFLLRPTLYLDNHKQPTSLSCAFDLFRNMSRVFRGQKARHTQRKCNASKPFSHSSCALIHYIFTFCIFLSSFEVKNVSGTLVTNSFFMRAAIVAVTDGWMKTSCLQIPAAELCLCLKCSFSGPVRMLTNFLL